MSVKERVTNAESRALITAVFMVLYFVTIWVLALFAPEFFDKVFAIITVFLANALGVFYGAKNGEKRLEQLLNYLPNLVASQMSDTLTKVVTELLKETQQKKPL